MLNFLKSFKGDKLWNLRRSIERLIKFKVKFSNGHEIINIRLEETDELIATGKLTTFPKNSGIVISSGVEVTDGYKGKGIGNLFNKYRTQIAINNNYSLMMCTVLETNIAQIKIMDKNNWIAVTKFLNKNTGNSCILYIKDISNGN